MTELEFNQMKEEVKYIVLKSEGLSNIWVKTMDYLKGAVIPIEFVTYHTYTERRYRLKISHPANYFSAYPEEDTWQILPEDIAKIIYKNTKIQGVHFL